jgi:undecaprenyl-diphosphatase
MLIVSSVILVGVTVGVVAAALARRWPSIESPRFDAPGIQRRLGGHPRLAAFFRARMNPAEATGFALTAFATVLVVCAVGIGILLLMIRENAGPARLDLRLAEFASQHATDMSTDFLRTVSILGGTGGTIGLALVVGVFEYRRIPSRALPAFLAVVVLGQFAVANIIKWIVDRARPAIDPLTGFAGTSFPSGHATASAAAFAAFAFLIGRRQSPRVKAALGGLAAGIAACVASSRVFLGVHWFTDVLAGLLVGWTWFAVCSIAFGGRLLRFGAPVETAEQVADDLASPSV